VIIVLYKGSAMSSKNYQNMNRTKGHEIKLLFHQITSLLRVCLRLRLIGLKALLTLKKSVCQKKVIV
jgi:hypothetical protein